MYELLLVSESPRRRQILSDAGFLFRVDTVKISEIIEENVNLEAAIVAIARAKGQAYISANNHLKSQDILVLSADTMVALGSQPLGKPENATEAEAFLRLLAGKAHRVITGIFLANMKTGECFEGFDSTEVEFRPLTDQEISDYVGTGEPLDKAGAYAIQGGGAAFVKSVKGSRLNVVGLPLELLIRALQERKWDVARRKV